MVPAGRKWGRRQRALWPSLQCLHAPPHPVRFLKFTFSEKEKKTVNNNPRFARSAFTPMGLSGVLRSLQYLIRSLHSELFKYATLNEFVSNKHHVSPSGWCSSMSCSIVRYTSHLEWALRVPCPGKSSYFVQRFGIER